MTTSRRRRLIPGWMPLPVYLALGGYGCTSGVHPVTADPELEVAATALADFLDRRSTEGVVRLHESLVAETDQFPDSAAWTSATDGFGLTQTRYPSLVGSYWRANRNTRPLTDPLPVAGRLVRLVDGRDRDFDDRDMVHFVSRVGFAPSGDSAIVFVNGTCGTLCGSGVLVLYVRSADGWHSASTLQHLSY